MGEVETSAFVVGPFEPRADELTQHMDLAACAVEGAVPVELRGTFLRIGPNPHFDFRGKPYHVFDGDGMIHSMHFAGGGQAGRCVRACVPSLAALLLLLTSAVAVGD